MAYLNDKSLGSIQNVVVSIYKVHISTRKQYV